MADVLGSVLQQENRQCLFIEQMVIDEINSKSDLSDD